METPIFSPEAAGAFDLNRLTPGAYQVPGFGMIDLCTISLKEATRLHAFGFPFLTPKPAPEQTPPPEAVIAPPIKEAAPEAAETGAVEETPAPDEKEFIDYPETPVDKPILRW